MSRGENIISFKNAYDAYEHCSVEMDSWHPKWQGALRSNDLAELRALADRYRHRILAVFPKEAYSGSWAGANTNFAYRLYELSEFEESVAHMRESRTLYQSHLPNSAPEWHGSLRSINEHCYAEILLRYAELTNEPIALVEANDRCAQALSLNNAEQVRVLSTAGAIQRRIAERESSIGACDRALDTLRRAEVDQTADNGDLSWALERQTFAALQLLKCNLGAEADLSAALVAVDQALTNYSLNPHNFWIRPSRRQDAITTKAGIERARR